ncbi:MAG: C40 family peptidase [Stomatobaculum sp.]|nr:C40 family peptidase [Stomatobaculum sp.]
MVRGRIVIGLAVVGLLIFSVQAISALVPVLESGLSAITAGTYPAEEADVRAAERAYAAKERDLQNELNHYERYHPGYDEYIIEADEIWHDPYALIAIISAYTNGEEWTIDSVGGIIDKFFAWQYEKTERITTEQHYRTEVVDGVETRVWYTKYICTVTLKNKDLSHAPVYTMSREQMGLYALYMSTHGNMDGIFRGGHASELKDPLRYDVPQELIDADPKFALLLEEANKRIGYPYVWGGYTPDTSFDCSGFISWIFTETGVVNIGHRGANGLWSMCQRVSAEEAKPGDIVFFDGTIPGEDGITHCGLYVGNGMMIHCGSPIGYADITKGYYKQHFYAFGRIYEH